LEQAIQDLEQYIELTPDAENREEVLTLIEELEAELSP
jgi:regulator of sirC expression with transglutaminase-like and TPR domain